MQIKLKNLTIINFKGIQQFEVDFNHITNIYGDNATGKTTVFDAFLWLFFGKNSEDVSQFEVKRLDKSNQFIKDLESEVVAILLVDQQEIAVKKILRQKWVKRRGEMIPNYNGDENIYYWNDVPLKEGEFKEKIKSILDENLFRLITNPFYFNSLKWQQRRNILIDIAGNITNDEILDKIVTVTNKGNYNGLISALNNGKTLDEYKRELAAKKKKIKDEAESIPSRIDEVRRGMPETRNFDAIRDEMILLKENADKIQLSMNDEMAMQQVENKRRTELVKEYNVQVRLKQQNIFNIKTKLQNIEFEAKQQAGEADGKLNAAIKSYSLQLTDKKNDRERYRNALSDLNIKLVDKEDDVQKLREKYAAVDEEQLQFNDHEFTCPACKQDLPAASIEDRKETLTANFNKEKLNRLNKIIAEANNAKAEIENIKLRISNANNTITSVNEEIDVIQAHLDELKEQASLPKQSAEDVLTGILASNLNYQELQQELTKLEAIELTEPTFETLPVNDNMKSELDAITAKSKELNRRLVDEETIEKSKQRIIQLENQESALAQELATLEGSEFAIMEFTKAKVDAIERRINGRFHMVKFKMFDTQVNGGEVECCETLINGVPFSDANNAARINAGIDIINTLCEHYKVHAPIFIDNRESVTRLIDSESQIVNLIVSEIDKKLRVA